MTCCNVRVVLTAAVLLVALPVMAQLPSSLRPESAAAGSEAVGLGPVFQLATAEISLRPPKGMIQSPQSVVTDQLAEFTDTAKGWTLTISRIRNERPVALTGDATPGLLELSTEKLKSSGQAEILRSDVINVGSTQNPDTALIVARLATGTKAQLLQQATVRSSDTLYYVVEMTAPGSKLGTGTENASDSERRAVETFNAVVDTIQLIDRRTVLEDQRKRLDSTRALFLNLKEDRFKQALVSERWVRHVQNGKDVGYSYIVEEESNRAGKSGVLIAVRTRYKLGGPNTPEQTDSESFMFTSFDMKYEEWSSVAKFTDSAGKTTSATELGSSSAYTQRSVIAGVPKGEKINGKQEDKQQPFVTETARRTVTVTIDGKAAVELAAGVSYIPQAVIHLLPRLVPLKEKKSYMFSTYLSDQRELFRRYLDVLPEGEVTLGGEKIRAIPVSDRVGYEGAPTIHYLSRDGRFLGSVDEKNKLMMLPTDSATLQQLWKNPDLSKPKAPARTYQQP